MNVRELIQDLKEIRQRCSDKETDLDEVDEDLQLIINELELSKEYKKGT